MLRTIRIALALVMIIGITLLFLDFTGTLHLWLGWMAKVQLLPAVMALNLVVIGALVLLTLVFGRIYCSVICPLGVMQDVIAWLHRKTSKKHKYQLTKAHSWLRYSVLALFIVSLVAGVAGIVVLLAPYSSYGRMVSTMLQPLYLLINNGLASIAEHFDSYSFYSVDTWLRSLPALLISIASFAVIFYMAWTRGRLYCNSICPVGTVLGFLSRFSLLKIRFRQDKCIDCGLCAKNCKSQCIDFKNHKIDYSRCVSCGTCLSKCKKAALIYGLPASNKSPKAPEPTTAIDQGKRAFLLGSALAAGTALMAQEKKKVDGGLAVIEDKAIPTRSTPLVPPGAKSLRHFGQHCTACQLCVAECPNQVLRPSTTLERLMQPEMSYERGFCRPECTRCSQVCPAGAIKPVERADKAAIQIGHAVWIKDNCVVLTDHVKCGNCARHCPAGAISMEPMEALWDGVSDNIPVVPVVNTERCIGCGACENVCPSRPFSAIYVEGHEQHREI